MAATIESLARTAILGLTEELLAGKDLTVATTASMLADVFSDSQLHFVDLDPASHDVAVATTGGSTDFTYRARLLDVLDDHPMIRSYLPLRWRHSRPRRLSDVISQTELRRTRTYNELMRPAGVSHQIAVLTSVHGTRGTAWVINRGGDDFTDYELEMAIALQPSLALLQYVFGRDEIGGQVSKNIAANNRYKLTERELEVLGLVSGGLTAVRIGHVLNISPRTVQQHLANAYAKLNTHDRLLAVTRARAEGLIS